MLPVSRRRRHVGMGGDKFVTAVAGRKSSSVWETSCAKSWEKRFDELIEEVAPFGGAHELLEETPLS